MKTFNVCCLDKCKAAQYLAETSNSNKIYVTIKFENSMDYGTTQIQLSEITNKKHSLRIIIRAKLTKRITV